MTRLVKTVEKWLHPERADDPLPSHRLPPLAFEVEKADAKTLARYGKNKFGLSLHMAFRFVEAGVSLVQVNLGKNSSWDTHRRNFVNLKENLFP